MAHLSLRGQPLGRFAAVLFDKDGTLSHSEPLLITLAEARVFHAVQRLNAVHPERVHDGSSIELETLLRRAYGLDQHGVHPAGTTAVASREHNLISTATALAQVGVGWPEALAMAHAVFSDTDGLHGEGAAAALPTDGLMELLTALSGAGLRCGVISNDGTAGIHHFLHHNGLSGFFSASWSADHQPCKPDPGAVHGLCDLLRVKPAECLLIGDANSDLRMALAAGLPTALGYTAGWQRRPPLDPLFPQLQHWSELAVMGTDGARVVSSAISGCSTAE
ncbi:HAD-IA family hydrolase [Synechococcus sp. CBW1107]|uniref:HAD family hydrolase n=1 Tax=Synechococcus sp. CBW1107 TaxID=2789857 RepID=UPI002AD41EB9|nr:HAD-IA family hydrolase [Synechococcus sp. CBW1107]CAK6700963.1 Phosphoglycolate phosphatase [Synechococcus sp. CBW1107]